MERYREGTKKITADSPILMKLLFINYINESDALDACMNCVNYMMKPFENGGLSPVPHALPMQEICQSQFEQKINIHPIFIMLIIDQWLTVGIYIEGCCLPTLSLMGSRLCRHTIEGCCLPTLSLMGCQWVRASLKGCCSPTPWTLLDRLKVDPTELDGLKVVHTMGH